MTLHPPHYFGFASTAYYNSSTLIWDRKKHPNRRHWFFSVKVTNCLYVRLWLRHWQCHMTKQAAHGQKTHTTATRLGNKYWLLMSDQFYISGRCRYVKKWLTSADNDITADISCIPIYFACLFQQLTSLLHQNLQVRMHYFHQLQKWQHANLFSSVLLIW